MATRMADSAVAPGINGGAVPRIRTELDSGRAVAVSATVVRSAASGAELRTVLRVAARGICLLLRAGRCSVYLADDAPARFRGYLAVPGPENDDAVRELVCGGGGDRFVAEIVETAKPVIVDDARTDPRLEGSVVRRPPARSLIGVPVVVDGDVRALLVVDDERRPRHFDAADESIAVAFADVVAGVVAQVRGRERREQQLVRTTRELEGLRCAAAIEERFAALAKSGADLAAAADEASAITGRPCSVLDHDGRPLALGGSSPRRGGLPALSAEALASVPDGAAALRTASAPTILGPLPGGACYLVAPIDDGRGYRGCVAVGAPGRRFGRSDREAVARLARFAGDALSQAARVREAGTYSRRTLLRDLLDETADADDLARRAVRHGLELDGRHVVAVVATDGGARELEAALRTVGVSDAPWVCADDGDELAFLLATDPRLEDGAARDAVREQAMRVVARIGGGARVGLSGLCHAAGDLPLGRREARAALRFAEQGRVSAAAVGDLGIDRVVRGLTGDRDGERFAEEVLGPLLRPDDDRVPGLLTTLVAYLDAGRSASDAARALGVHANTVRYRLGRIAELVGLDVANDPDHQVTASVALRAVRGDIIGRAAGAV